MHEPRCKSRDDEGRSVSVGGGLPGATIRPNDGSTWVTIDPRSDPMADMARKLLAQAPDPWAHRAERMRCRTCMWFAPKGGDLGRCRRHAPTLSGYPAVYTGDWCGDHKMDETK